MMGARYLALMALNAFIAVACGAFGAHALKTRLTPELLDTWQTAVQYQMFHCVGLLAVALWPHTGTNAALLKWSGRLFGVGLVLFCGSLYVLALSGVRILGAITPIGGVAWLLAWALLAKAALSSKPNA
jgi:uncharacterized membrane protein YgdD (TMEM256/DUF423 family)